MAETPILEEIKPTAGVDFTLYSTPALSSSSGTIFCLNQGSSNDKISIGLIQAGNPTDPTVWVAYQTTIYPGHNIYLQQIHLGSDDIIIVNSQTGTTNFVFTGLQLN